MKTLIIHHLETMWEYGYKKFGTTFSDIAEKIVCYLEESCYDRVILTRFEDDSFEDEHFDTGLVHYIGEIYDYAYGWHRDSLDLEDDSKLPDDFTEGGYHSDIVYVPDWVKSLKTHQVSLCGAFDGECIEDMEIALTAAEVKFERLNALIVG